MDPSRAENGELLPSISAAGKTTKKPVSGSRFTKMGTSTKGDGIMAREMARALFGFSMERRILEGGTLETSSTIKRRGEALCFSRMKIGKKYFIRVGFNAVCLDMTDFGKTIGLVERVE